VRLVRVGNEQLAAFLAARLDEDESLARAASPGPWDRRGDLLLLSVTDTAHIVRHEPARVLRDIQGKQAIVRHYTKQVARGSRNLGHLDTVCRHLASVYADHPDFRQQWMP
jgi:hypothetical protein